MGKSLIIRDTNFSSVSVGKVEFVNPTFLSFELSRGLDTDKIMVINPAATDKFGTFIYSGNIAIETNVYNNIKTVNIPIGETIYITGVADLAIQIAGYQSAWDGIENATVADYAYSDVYVATTDGIAGDTFVWTNNTNYENFCFAFLRQELLPDTYNSRILEIENPNSIKCYTIPDTNN